VAEQKYRGFVEDLLTKEYDSPLKGVVASTVLGSREFVQKITESHLAGQSFDRSLPASRKLISRPTLKEIVSNVTMLIVEREDLRRSMSIYSCQRYSGAKLKEIGAYFGISDAAVSQTSRRLVLKAEKDRDIRDLLDRIETQIKYVSS
jgi:hypothetical protein